MLSVSGEAGGHVIGHMSDHVISWGWYWKGVQTTFLKELIIILRRGQLRAKVIDIKLKNIENFSPSQNVGLVCR